jgi:hypothetical protein
MSEIIIVSFRFQRSTNAPAKGAKTKWGKRKKTAIREKEVADSVNCQT